MKRTIYVVGFAFGPDRKHVALIEKTKAANSHGVGRPDWLKNKYNGIGTDIKNGEEPRKAMMRTFKERTGAQSYEEDWKQFAQIENDEAVVMFFKCDLQDVYWAQVRSTTTETVHKAGVHALKNYPLVTNLHWLIPMALDPGHNFALCLDSRVEQIQYNEPLYLWTYKDMSDEEVRQSFSEFAAQTSKHLEKPVVDDLEVLNQPKWNIVDEDGKPLDVVEDVAENGCKVYRVIGNKWKQSIAEGVMKMMAQSEDQIFIELGKGSASPLQLVMMLTQKELEVRHGIMSVAEIMDIARTELVTVISEALDVLKGKPNTPETWEEVELLVKEAIEKLPPLTGNTVGSTNGTAGTTDVPGEKNTEGGEQNKKDIIPPAEKPHDKTGDTIAAGDGAAKGITSKEGVDAKNKPAPKAK